MAEGPLAPQRIDDATLTRWRAVLRQAEFDDDFIARCETVAPRMLDAVRLPAVRWWLRQQDPPAAVLARLVDFVRQSLVVGRIVAVEDR